jgi:hypothetical protein
MNFSEIYERSKKIKAEILVEVKYCTVLQEKIGLPHKVEGKRFAHESDVYHTHLDEHPPSAQDLLTGLMCNVLYGTKISGVIGSIYIYQYQYRNNLRRKFKSLFYHNYENKNWKTKLYDELTKINSQFIKIKNKSEYLNRLFAVGIIMTLEERN